MPQRGKGNREAERSVDIELRGGTLHIDWDASTNHVFMTGGAATVFTGLYQR